MESVQMEIVNNEREDIFAPKVEDKAYKMDGTSFGFVIYADSCFYTNDPLQDSDKHMIIEKLSLGHYIEKNIFCNLKNKCCKMIIGHEHGDENKKCHFQCAVKTIGRNARKMEPSSFTIDNFTYLIMFQRAKNIMKLWNYCKKKKDFLEIDFDTRNPFHILANEKGLTTNEISNIFLEKDPRTFLLYAKNIQEHYRSYAYKQVLPSFEWKFPDHLLEWIRQDFSGDRYLRIEQDKWKWILWWFENHCKPNLKRRLCLFLVSHQRGMGKTTFATSLVNHEKYYIHCKGSLNGADFEGKDETAKLIILDDVNFYVSQSEMWKALIAGESVSINTKYCNRPWRGGVPCIVMTNNLDHVNYWRCHNDYKTQCLFINLQKYIGPDGTRPQFLEETHVIFDDEFTSMLEKRLREVESKKLYSFN